MGAGRCIPIFIKYLEDPVTCPVTVEHLVGPSTRLNSPAQSPRNTLHRLGCPLKEVLLIEKAPILGVLGVRGGQRLLYQTPLDKGPKFSARPQGDTNRLSVFLSLYQDSTEGS